MGARDRAAVRRDAPCGGTRPCVDTRPRYRPAEPSLRSRGRREGGVIARFASGLQLPADAIVAVTIVASAP